MSDSNSQVLRARPTAIPEGIVGAAPIRRSGYGDAYVLDVNERAIKAEEGSYYTVTNPTIDTAAACGIITAYVVTTPLFLVSNTAAAGGRVITLDALKLLVTVAPASATNWKYVVDVDSSTRLSTAPTGGANRAIKNVNPSKPNDAEATVYAFTGGTVLTVMAAQDARTIGNGRIAMSIPIALDELVIQFGGPQVASSPATAVSRRIATCPPVVIPPGCSAAIHMFGTSNAATGLSAEYELSFWQR